METRNLFKLIVLLFCAISFVSCLDDEEEEGKKVIGHKEYTLTVASQKLEGTVTLNGSNILTEVYATKKKILKNENLLPAFKTSTMKTVMSIKSGLAKSIIWTTLCETLPGRNIN